MKRKLALCLALLLLLALPCAMAETYVDIQSVYNETPDWQAIYYLPHSEDYAALSANYSFDVNLTPSVPDVERFPVFRVKMRPLDISETELARFYQYDNMPDLRESQARQRAMGYAHLKTGGVIADYPWADFFWRQYDEMETARDNPLSPDDAAAIASGLWQRYLGMDNIRVRGVIGYSWEPRFYGEYLSSDTPEGRKTYTLERGAYTVVGEALLGGIPLMDTVTLWTEDWSSSYPQVAWQITLLDEDRFIFQGSAVEVVETVQEDVPLLPFSRIREIYETTLSSRWTEDYQWQEGTPWEQGKPLIHPLSAELGYVMMLEPGTQGQGADTTYITAPVWIIRGYAPEELWGGEKLREATIAAAQTELNHPKSMEYGLYMHTNFMCIHAQTGEVLNWPNLGCNYWEDTADIVTWEGM